MYVREVDDYWAEQRFRRRVKTHSLELNEWAEGKFTLRNYTQRRVRSTLKKEHSVNLLSLLLNDKWINWMKREGGNSRRRRRTEEAGFILGLETEREWRTNTSTSMNGLKRQKEEKEGKWKRSQIEILFSSSVEKFFGSPARSIFQLLLWPHPVCLWAALMCCLHSWDMYRVKKLQEINILIEVCSEKYIEWQKNEWRESFCLHNFHPTFYFCRQFQKKFYTTGVQNKNWYIKHSCYIRLCISSKLRRKETKVKGLTSILLLSSLFLFSIPQTMKEWRLQRSQTHLEGRKTLFKNKETVKK